jgi:uncharacterized protein (TIGR02118 family)
MYCSRILDSALPGLSLEFDGTALLSCPTIADLHTHMPPDVREKIDVDELRVFSTYVEEFTLRCEETLVLGGTTGKVAIIRFLARKPGGSRDAFDAHCSGHHAGLAMSALESGDLLGYAHNRVIEEPPQGYEFDGITELWFEGADEAHQALARGPLYALGQDVSTFCDVDRSVTLFARITHLWPRA